MKKTKYDIIIIGAGSAGLNVAGFLSRLNLSVLLVDKNDNSIGGDCLNTGCIPSKALIHVANQIHKGKLSQRFLHEGIKEFPSVDIKKVISYIHSKQEIIRMSENPEYLRKKGVDYMSGEVKFVDACTISLDGNLYTAKNFVLATGSRSRSLSVENDGSLPLYSNESIFSITSLPQHFIFIGGGPINCELGQAFSHLGSKVTILHSGARILEKEECEVSAILAKSFEDEGVSVITNIKLQKIANKKVFYTREDSDEVFEVEGDAVFVGIGRELNIQGLDLEKANIQVNDSHTKLIVDDYLRTTNKHVYVVGDVAGNYQFTHAAEMHAKVVISNMLSPFKKKFDADTISWVTYTTPEVSTFGLSKEMALLAGCEVLVQDFDHEDRAIVDECQNGKLMLYVTKKGQIKGGTMVADNAGELTQELVLATSARIQLSVLFKKVYAYPTAGRINKRIASVWESKKLTSFTKKMLQFLYKI